MLRAVSDLMCANGHLLVVVADFGARSCPAGRNDVARIQHTTLHEPRNAIYNLLATVFYFKSLFCLKLTR